MIRGIDIVRELATLPPAIRPLQFNNLITGSQYLPIYRLANRFIKPGARALDWGCGNGHFSYFLLRQGVDVQGFRFEADATALSGYLSQRFPAAYHMQLGDPQNPVHLPFPDQSFDLVFSIGVLEHVRETGGAEAASLAEIARILRPEGHFICGMLPKRYSWIEFVVRQLGPGRHVHLFRYTERDIQRMMRNAGLQLHKTETHGFLPRNSWNHPSLLPISSKALVNHTFNKIDHALASCVSPIAQNFMFAASRPNGIR